jgi:signal transduction protein with GAF and PtsI domain
MVPSNEEQWLAFWERVHRIIWSWEAAAGTRMLGVREASVLAERIAGALLDEYNRGREAAAAQLQGLSEVALALATAQDPATAVEIVATSAMELLGADGCGLYAPHEDGTHLRVIAAYGTFALPELPVSLGQGAAGRAFVSGRPVMIEDYANWEGGVPELRALSLGACVAMPLVVGGRSRGCLIITYQTPHACAHECLRTLTVLAGLGAPLLCMTEPTDTDAAARNAASADPTPEARAARLLSLELSNLLSRGEVVFPKSTEQRELARA